MAGFGKDKKNPGPKEQEFTTQKNLQRPRGKVASSSGKSAGSDEQFNKGSSYDEDDGKLASRGEEPRGSGISGVGSSAVKDEQFTKNTSNSGKLGGKSSGGTPGSFDSSAPSAAQQIMRAIASSSQKAEQHPTSYEGSKKVSPAKSSSQTKSYKDTTQENGQVRPKSQVTQKVPKK